MKPHFLPEQAPRTTHTPAIFDSGAPSAVTHASTGFAGSTALNEAVHIRDPSAYQANADVRSRMGSRP